MMTCTPSSQEQVENPKEATSRRKTPSPRVGNRRKMKNQAQAHQALAEAQVQAHVMNQVMMKPRKRRRSAKPNGQRRCSRNGWI